MHPTIAKILTGCFVVLVLLAARERALLPDGRMHVTFLDVGQGDAELITFRDGSRMLIDGGPDWAALEALGKRLPFFDRGIDVVVLSHPNTDHMVSLPEVLRRYRVRTLVTAGTTFDSGLYRAILSGAALRQVHHTVLRAGDSLRIDDAALTVLWPPIIRPQGMDKDVNNDSLVLRLEERGKRVLFTGDLESIVERTLVAAGVDLRADILKVGHHGSATSSSYEFLRAVRPSTAIISVGRENPYRHPHPGVMERLRSLGIEFRRTDTDGTIDIVW